jgi:peptidoglycan-associated lipoprotein
MFIKKLALVGLSLSLLLVTEGCKKKVVAAKPTAPVSETTVPPPAPKKPSIGRFSAEPSAIEKGQASTLRWSVEDATEVTISSLGAVGLSGSRQVYPGSDMEYVLTAKGPGGSTTASARISVTAAAAPASTAPVSSVGKPSFSERLERELGDIYFNYDQSDISGPNADQMTKNATALKAIFADHPNGTVTVEGHADERGSAEYNIGLGDRRATSTKDFLLNLGIDSSKLKVVSYGKERPQCMEDTDACHSKNRRAHFVAAQ